MQSIYKGNRKNQTISSHKSVTTYCVLLSLKLADGNFHKLRFARTHTNEGK